MTSIENRSLPVLLSIRGEQDFDGVDPDATELMTEGTMELSEEGLTLRYHESALTGMEGTVTTFTVEGPGGFPNTIEVEHGRIRVREAGCPDQVCVGQGYISDGTVPIVCLPNKLVIEITGGGDSLDAAAG